MKLGKNSVPSSSSKSKAGQLKKDLEKEGMCVYLMIYGEHCGHCHNAMPDWIKLEKMLEKDKMAVAWSIEAGALSSFFSGESSKIGTPMVLAVPEFRHIHVNKGNNSISSYDKNEAPTFENLQKWYHSTKPKSKSKKGGGCGCNSSSPAPQDFKFLGGGKSRKSRKSMKSKKTRKSKKMKKTRKSKKSHSRKRKTHRKTKKGGQAYGTDAHARELARRREAIKQGKNVLQDRDERKSGVNMLTDYLKKQVNIPLSESAQRRYEKPASPSSKYRASLAAPEGAAVDVEPGSPRGRSKTVGF
jgi:thiol-disulfide isomerase/thioredoxin